LEILMQHLEDKPLFLEWKSKFWLPFSTKKWEVGAGESENFHDALYDAKSTLALFCYLISFIQQMEEKQPIIKQFLAKSDALLSTLLRKE
jgi:hypothetical protein